MISKETIDAAGKLREAGMNYADIAEQLYKEGHRYVGTNSKIHNQGLHAAVIKDPDWVHLRVKRSFSKDRMVTIAKAMAEVGIESDLIGKTLQLLDY